MIIIKNISIDATMLDIIKVLNINNHEYDDLFINTICKFIQVYNDYFSYINYINYITDEIFSFINHITIYKILQDNNSPNLLYGIFKLTPIYEDLKIFIRGLATFDFKNELGTFDLKNNNHDDEYNTTMYVLSMKVFLQKYNSTINKINNFRYNTINFMTEPRWYIDKYFALFNSTYLSIYQIYEIAKNAFNKSITEKQDLLFTFFVILYSKNIKIDRLIINAYVKEILKLKINNILETHNYFKLSNKTVDIIEDNNNLKSMFKTVSICNNMFKFIYKKDGETIIDLNTLNKLYNAINLFNKDTSSLTDLLEIIESF